MAKEIYNKEPVYYCKACLSLAILVYGDTSSFCNDCGSTKVAQCSIEQWEKLYKDKFGISLLERKDRG